MTFDETEKTIETLNQISKNYHADSVEHEAIKCAITAVGSLFEEKGIQRFLKWRENRELTDAQRTHLEGMGINPDTGELLF
ncbi:MAG: hypothetical protein WC334_07475 [Kiritimatiellales bacterium]